MRFVFALIVSALGSRAHQPAAYTVSVFRPAFA